MLVRYVCDSCRTVLLEESVEKLNSGGSEDVVVLSTLCPDCKTALEKESTP